MKVIIISVFFLASFVKLLAGIPDSISKQPDPTYSVGIYLTAISHHIYYKNPTTSGEVKTGYFRPFSLNFGYKLNSRAGILIGLAYGSNKEQARVITKDDLQVPISYEVNAQTKVLAMPIAMQFIFVNVNGNLPFYATASFLPAYGITMEKILKTRENETTIYHDVKDSGINTFFTAGVGCTIKATKHFSGFTELSLIKSNLSGNNSKYYDYYSGGPGFLKFIASVGIGVNYNF